MKTTQTILLLVVAAYASATLIAPASESAVGESLDLTTLMQAKLASSQRITEGLVTKDFELIRKGALEWRQIAAATKWNSHSDPVFAQHRAELSRLADKLVRAAEEKNLDSAAYTYFGSLRTCIGCHEHCRDVLHVPTIRRNPKAVMPIPVTDDEPSTLTRPTAGASSR